MNKNKQKIIVGVIIALVIILISISLKVFDGGISKDPYVGYWVMEGDTYGIKITKDGNVYKMVSKMWPTDVDEGYYDKEQDLVIIDSINLSGLDKDNDFAYRYDKETDTLTEYNYHIKEGKISDNRTVTYFRSDNEF